MNRLDRATQNPATNLVGRSPVRATIDDVDEPHFKKKIKKNRVLYLFSSLVVFKTK